MIRRPDQPEAGSHGHFEASNRLPNLGQDLGQNRRISAVLLIGQCTLVRRVCFPTLPFPARSRRISSVAGSSREPAFAGQPGRETRGTAIPPATSMAWHKKRHWCLATSAAYLAKFRCADNGLTHRGSQCFYLALPSSVAWTAKRQPNFRKDQRNSMLFNAENKSHYTTQ